MQPDKKTVKHVTNRQGVQFANLAREAGVPREQLSLWLKDKKRKNKFFDELKIVLPKINEKSILKQLLFEYITLKMIEWFFELNKIQSINEFNKKNSFSEIKVLLFPFFIFAAGYKREELIKIFNNFVASAIGIIDLDIARVDGYLKNDLFVVNIFNTILCVENLELKDGVLLPKNKDYFKPVENEIEIITKAIEILKSKNLNFINSNDKTFQFGSMRHNSWQIFFPDANFIQRVPTCDLDKTYKIYDFILLSEKSIFSGFSETHSYL